MHDKHASTIRCGPVKLAFPCVRTNAAPENCAINAKSTQDLRHLRDVAKAVGEIADAHGFAELCGPLQADLQVTYQRLPTDEEFVGLQVPWTDSYAARACMTFQAFLLVWSHL